LLGQYQAWASQTGVQDWDLLLPRLLAAWHLQTVDG
jgi:arylsulfatase